MITTTFSLLRDQSFEIKKKEGSKPDNNSPSLLDENAMRERLTRQIISVCPSHPSFVVIIFTLIDRVTVLAVSRSKKPLSEISREFAVPFPTRLKRGFLKVPEYLTRIRIE